jgi:hypothetical protein
VTAFLYRDSHSLTVPFPFCGSSSDYLERRRANRGRPKTGIGPNIGLRLYPELDAALDAWIAKQPEPKPSRPEAIRRILRQALKP